MFRMTSALAALAIAAFAAGCATPQASNEPTAAKAAEKDPKISHKNDSDDYITGSRLPRKSTQNTEGTVGASAAEMRRYEPPQGRSIQ